MNEELKNKINEQLQILPKQYRDVIDNFGWEKIIENIGKENGLYDEQIEDLLIETVLVIIGLVDFDDFIYNIEDNLIVEREIGEKIVNEINFQLLEPLEETLKKTFPELIEDIEDEETIKNSLENPPVSKSISFVEQKMNTSHTLDQKSISVPIPPGEKYNDPYREII